MITSTNNLRLQDLAKQIQVSTSIPGLDDAPGQCANEFGMEPFKAALDLVEKYKKTSIHDLEFSEIMQDMVELQALQVSIAPLVGDLESRANAMASYADMLRSKIRNDLRKKRAELEDQGASIRGTVDEVKDIADELSLPCWLKAEQAKIRANSAKFIYYGIRDTTVRLDSVLGKLYDERFHRD